jgi:hypothetical protein
MPHTRRRRSGPKAIVTAPGLDRRDRAINHLPLLKKAAARSSACRELARVFTSS